MRKYLAKVDWNNTLKNKSATECWITVDEVRGTEVTRKLYIITEELGDERWQVQLVSTKEEPRLVQSPVGEQTLKNIGTHDGPFHCDEALACFMLKQLPEYKDAHIIRTNDPVMLDICDVIVDVGGKYDPAHNRYDHHQSGFNETMKSLDSAYPWKTKLSSAGLVYYHYGHRVLAEIMGSDEEDEEMINRIYSKFYSDFVEAVDAIDNGIMTSLGGKLFLINTCLGDRISNLNHYWNDPYDARNPDVQFLEAMKLIELEFNNVIIYLKTVWWPARGIVATAITKRSETDRSGQVLYLNIGCSWKEHLFDLETEQSLGNIIKYVLFYDELTTNYTVQCVPKYLHSYNVRLHLPHRWRGLEDDDLRRESGVRDSVFVHRAGHIGFGRTFESVLEMASKALHVTRSSAEQWQRGAPQWRKDEPQWRQDAPQWRQDEPQMWQDEPQWRQDEPQRRQGAPQWRPSEPQWRQGAPKWRQNAPQWRQDAPQWRQDALQWRQDAPQSRQDEPQRRQGAPLWRPSEPQGRPSEPQWERLERR